MGYFKQQLTADEKAGTPWKFWANTARGIFP